jgi:mannose-1-phosphate guanylyltransferase/mannose-6-phosphate isomerase
MARQRIEIGSLILEPLERNTALAIAVAALRALMISPDAVLLVQPADHVLAEFAASRDAVRS